MMCLASVEGAMAGTRKERARQVMMRRVRKVRQLLTETELLHALVVDRLLQD